MYTDYLPTLKRCKLFYGLSDEEIISALGCLNASVKTYKKSDVIFAEGDVTEYIGIVLSGEVEVQKSDFLGNANIISRQFAGGVIGAAVSYSQEKRLPFDIISAAESVIMYLDNNRLITQCPKLCAFHAKIIVNMLAILSDKNIQLTDKIDILTKRSIREKLTAYLYSQSKKAKNKRFAINLTRRQLADYLSVNRSAMIRELTNMRQDGIIDFENNIFWFN